MKRHRCPDDPGDEEKGAETTVNPILLHRMNDLHVQDIHAVAARAHLVARARPARIKTRATLSRYLTAALAAVAWIFGYH
jgi:hypothetical protein